ncbi:CidA/LrgA family protein [Propionivibrio limicola]|uniref:CidA/LrgA family protein n=1 Tax=Propionivibrio limicola TaxID=167645 RepID=UPI0012915D9B|nr:CidA/LrgA family protein [Propionivibrio limicola]
MINTLTLLLLFQLGGELFVRLLGLPIPGAVIGMSLLFLTLLVRGEASHALKKDTSALLQHLSLLFVPAGVGIMLHLQRVGREWLPITLALVISTFLGMAVAAGIIGWLALKDTRREERGKP